MAAPPSSRLQQALQSAVQSVQWTYSLFWQLCPQQGIMVWGDGYYNGSIKTRKTVQPMEASAEEASLQRSQQLRELYESLSSGEAGHPAARRPCAALLPEDLTESEWFYLMCVSFSFPPGVGLPGKAFAKRVHVWLTQADEADSRDFSRAILAKSAGIQTVLCIPLMDGILELGSTEKVEEDIGLIQHAKSFFTDHLEHQSKPSLSEHSTSNPVACANQPLFHSQPVAIIQPMSVDPHESNKEEEDENDDGDDGDAEDEEDNDENDNDEVEACSESEDETGRYCAEYSAQPIHHGLTAVDAAIPAAELSELMELEMSEGIRVGSPDGSNNLDSGPQMLAIGHTSSSQSDLQYREDSYNTWHFLDEDLGTGFPQSSGAIQIQDMPPEDAHYSETVFVVLQQNAGQSADSSSISYIAHSRQSAFSKWHYEDHVLAVPPYRNPQRVLKHLLFSVPNLHCKYKDENSPKSRDGEGGNRFRKGTPQEEQSANHVLAERRRREKLNERFIILRSLVPFVTKMDKASILGDTIEYVKQLRRHIQELEAQKRKAESNRNSKIKGSQRPNNSKDQTIQTNSISPGMHRETSSRNRVVTSGKRKLRIVEGGTGIAKATKEVEAPSTNVQVSIIETDALLELQCPYRDGLLLKIMQTLYELRLEITSIQSSSANGTFVAELRAKVKEIHGKKSSIVEVKKAIHHIFSRYSF